MVVWVELLGRNVRCAGERALARGARQNSQGRPQETLTRKAGRELKSQNNPADDMSQARRTGDRKISRTEKM